VRENKGRLPEKEAQLGSLQIRFSWYVVRKPAGEAIIPEI